MEGYQHQITPHKSEIQKMIRDLKPWQNRRLINKISKKNDLSHGEESHC